MRIPTTAATILAAAGLALGVATAPASASVKTFTVPGGTEFVQVNVPTSHGPVVHFKVWYAADDYRHEDILPASQNVREIDNYTGAAPDVQGYDGCRNTLQPDELFKTDVDRYGIPGGTTRATGLHHFADLTFRPLGTGPYFLWCHYEHGAETWVVLTFADGMQVSIVWAVPTYFREILIDRGGTVTTVAPVLADE